MRLQETTEQGEWGRPVIWHDTWRMASDFPLTGVGAGAFERAMLVYQEGSRLFFFNHAHNEYLQLLAEGGLLIAVPAAIAVLAAIVLMREIAGRRSHADLLGPRRRQLRPPRGRGAEHLGYRPADAGQRRALRGDRRHRPARSTADRRSQPPARPVATRSG